MNNLHTLFLDFDGTLANSLAVMEEVFFEFLRLHQISSYENRFHEFNGPTLENIVKIIKDENKINVSLEKMLSDYESIIDVKYKNVYPASGGVSLLHKAKLLGIKVYIVSSNRRRLIDGWLSKLVLNEYIDGIIGSEDVMSGKPDPEPYLAGLKLSGCEAAMAIAVEDSLQGVKSSLSANLKTYYISSNEHQAIDHPLLSKVTHIKSLNSLLDIF